MSRSTSAGVPWTRGSTGAWANTFVVQDNPNLADPQLERIELRDPRRKEALLLLRDGYYFYERVPPQSTLIPQLESEDSTGCCYGYTHTLTYQWRWTDERP